MRYHEWLTAPHPSNGDFRVIVNYLHELCGASLSAAQYIILIFYCELTNLFFSSMETDPQSKKIQQLKFLGTISGNCIIVDSLWESIQYSSWMRALLWKGHQTINVFTWPGVKAGYVLEPLSGILNRLLVGPTSAKTSNTVLIINTTLVASQTPAPTLTHADEGYCPKQCWGIPHSMHLDRGGSSALANLIYGCHTNLLKHQQEALDFIQWLESPELTILTSFRDCSACKWLQNLFSNLVASGKTRKEITQHTSGSILAEDMGLGKRLNSLALITSSKNVVESPLSTL
ncbi:hypothetical protein VP01_4739g1 [Puccinia sorghi]|uniref:SNF2 N-terminal domain-containing protein n=1 Tax=Puccinia sorghi TaxID=27349 RepID=A0A0L6UMX1_9BASI|nr:hypothetical protein VP01_4739g1 [Puccinia sorghi]